MFKTDKQYRFHLKLVKDFIVKARAAGAYSLHGLTSEYVDEVMTTNPKTAHNKKSQLGILRAYANQLLDEDWLWYTAPKSRFDAMCEEIIRNDKTRSN